MRKQKFKMMIFRGCLEKQRTDIKEEPIDAATVPESLIT